MRQRASFTLLTINSIWSTSETSQEII